MIAALLAAVAVLLAALAVYVWNSNSARAVNRAFALYTLSLAGWTTGIAGLQAGVYLDVWSRIAFGSASVIPPAFLWFVKTYPTLHRWPPQPVLVLTLLSALAFATLALTSAQIAQRIVLGPGGPTREPGPLYGLFAAYMLLTSTAGVALFIARWARARGQARAQLQYLGIGLLILAVGGLSANLILPWLAGHSTYSWLGPFFVVPMVVLVGHAIIRHRLLDLRLILGRGAIRVTLLSVLSALMVLAAHLTTFADLDGSVLLPIPILVLAAIVLMTLVESTTRALERAAHAYLYRGRIDYVPSLMHAAHRLGRLMHPAEVGAQLKQILTETLVPETIMVVIQPAEGAALQPLTSEESADWLESIFAALRSSPRTVIVDPERCDDSVSHRTLHERGIAVVTALGRRGQLFGLVCLGPRRSGDAYYAKDLLFIEALADLASIGLENALLHRQRIEMLEYSKRLLESLDSAIVAVDVRGRVTNINQTARSLLGSPAQDPVSLIDLPPEVGWALAFALRDAWEAQKVEVTIERRGGGVLPLIVSTALLRDDRQRIAGALVIATDLSTVKALEHNERRLERLSLMARFYAGIAHEIRSPLTAISNFISMLPDRFDDAEYRAVATRLLPMEVARIVRLADRLRFMAPSRDGRLGPVSLAPLLSDIIAINWPTGVESGVRILLECPADLPTIEGDANQLVQLFLNLIRNGIEAMPGGGTLTIHGSVRNEAVVIDVCDEGTGIEASIRSNLFQPFVTTKPLGTGLGLAICREIADFHRARLTLTPRADRAGSVATVEFSIARRSGQPDLVQLRQQAMAER